MKTVKKQINKKFRPVGRQNLSGMIAERMEEMILSQDFKVGERLPSENSMAEQFGVSRNILREAISILAGRGLVTPRTGAGIYVSEPKKTDYQGMMDRYIRLGDVSLDQVYEMRLALEPAACGQAALRRTEQELKALNKIHAGMEKVNDNEKQWGELELKFHCLIAEMSGNSLFSASIHSLAGLLFSLFTTGYHTPDAPAQGLRGHSEIVKAICDQDSSKAEDVMKKHLEDSRRHVLLSKSKYKTEFSL